MNRNVEERFALNPTNIDISRSTFDRSHSLKTSWNVGDVVPFYVDEVLPGDTFNVKSSKVVRLQTLMTPMFDNLYLDTYYYFVPNRLVWKHWREFMGENTQSAWIPQTEYAVPQIMAPEGGWNVGTLADYFGIPTGVPNISVNALPFRAYALIMNEWFRDENIVDPLVIPDDDGTVTGVNTANYITDIAKGGAPFVAAKYHDYFTSALPSPQKGPDVTLPVASGGNLPVYSLADTHFTDLATAQSLGASNLTGVLNSSPNSSTSVITNFSTSTGGSNVYPNNLWAIQSGDAAAATINQLRLAFQIQKLYEKDARGGKNGCLHVKKIAEKNWKS